MNDSLVKEWWALKSTVTNAQAELQVTSSGSAFRPPKRENFFHSWERELLQNLHKPEIGNVLEKGL